MAHGGRPLRRPWATAIRAAPLGILILAALLFFIGAGLVLGGFFLAISRGDAGWMPWLMALAVGPTVLYLAAHLLLLTSWARLAMLALVALLTASSVVRVLGSSDRVAPLAELAAEGLCLLYLLRADTRRAFAVE